MSKIMLLDCTLRDGGYVNNWHFGEDSIKDILKKLVDTQVEFVECGYLSQKKGGDPNDTQYAFMEDVWRVIPKTKLETQQYAVMINYGEYSLEDIPGAQENSPVIRVCFHKKDCKDALEYCHSLKDKGYKVFVQAMASLIYSDAEFIELIQKTNAFKPYGFHIVDSFGAMETKELHHLISLVVQYLDREIILGYHSHNNLQQAYENAKFFIEQQCPFDILIDASVYGIGRGAGNLNMELIAPYLNKNYGKTYYIDPMLDVMDTYLKPIFMEHAWGYSLPYYLSAQYNCHPNYANYFSEKNTLDNRSMRQLLSGLPDDVKISFSVETAERYYRDFQRNNIDDSDVKQQLKESLGDRNILILAPGKSLETGRAIIESFIVEKEPIIFAINVMPNNYQCDYLFCTNEKRVSQLKRDTGTKLIVSSNIMEKVNADLVVNYASYLLEEKLIEENPTLMLINLLTEIGIRQITLAGFDGYRADAQENYFADHLSMGTSLAVKIRKNEVIRNKIASLGRNMDVLFLTESLYR